MNYAFALADSLSLADLRVFLGRAGRIDDGSARLIASGDVLAVYVAAFYPSGLLDASPTVLGLRTFTLAAPIQFDVVVPVRSLLESLVGLQEQSPDSRTPVTVIVPAGIHMVAWAAISPPRGGWTSLDAIDASVLERTARSGIEEVASAIPAGTGEQIVHRVRARVWSRPTDGLKDVPAGGAFAALSLGFLGADEKVRIYETGQWLRLSTQRGHVLIKRGARSLLANG